MADKDEKEKDNIPKEEDRILYDLSIPHEWPETATLLSDNNYKSLWKMITMLLQAIGWFIVTLIKSPTRLLSLSTQPPSVLSDLVGSRLPWQLILSNNGYHLAVLQDDQIEIRSNFDGFTSIKGTIKVSLDSQPQWRKAVWDPQGKILAYANSKGQIFIYDCYGSLLHTLSDVSNMSPTTDVSLLMTAVSGMIFIPPSNTDPPGSLLLVVTTYQANVTTYIIKSHDSHMMLHSVSLLNYCPYGIGAIQYISQHNLLIIAGWCDDQEEHDIPLVSCWRLDTESPYLIPAPGNEMKKLKRGSLRSFVDRRKFNENWIFTMAVSPNEASLASLSLSGQLCIWDLPSCHLKSKWLPEELPGSHESHMTMTSFEFETLMSKAGKVVPLEVTWWSNESLILVNSHFKMTILSAKTLCNLLGAYPEPGASITPGCSGQLLMLESKVYTRVLKRKKLLPSLSEDVDGEDDDNKLEEEEEEEDGTEGKGESDDREDESSFQKKMSLVAKQILYFLTEREQFKPPKEKQKELCTQYSLVCLESLAPEECYQRKMENEEYGEALELAQRYGLDCDLVYQRQWQLSYPVTVAAIQDYLSRVSKRSWVLQECLHCVAPDFLTMNELYLYALHCTTFKELNALRSEDDWQALEEEEEEGDTRKDPISIISNWRSLSEEQLFLCQCRETLLEYLNRLNTYEVILGGPAATFEFYDAEFFKEFRTKNLVRSAIEFAQDGNWRAVKALFDRHGDTVLPHRLAILSNFPETTSPKEYSRLLPSVCDGVMKDWEEEVIREMDWVQHPSIKKMYSLGRQLSYGDFIYEENPDLREYLQSPVTANQLTCWYSNRATEIEEFSGQVDNALYLVNYGIKKEVEGLETLQHHLQTLSSLIYHCNVDVHLNLTKLETLSHLEILQLMMGDVTGEQFVSHFSLHAMPFVTRLIKLGMTSRTNLLEEFMVIASKNDLRPCVHLLQSSKERTALGVSLSSLTTEVKISLALKCIYVCERTDQLDEVDAIMSQLPISELSSDLSQQLADLDHFIYAADILKTYDILKPIKYIKDIKDNTTEAEQLMRRLTRAASRKYPPLTEKGWRGLLQHLVTLKSRVFHCIELDICYEIFTESLLCSGSIDNIFLAREVLTVNPLSPQHSLKSVRSTSTSNAAFSYKLPYDVSLEVVVKATQEYFNSAAGPRDKEIDLARLCIGLVKDDPLPLVILSEMNLISSLDILTEFNIKQLPIQVRLCENKLDFIRQALDTSPTAYKKYDKLFKLSYFLGLSSEPDTSLHSMSSWNQMSSGRGYTTIAIALSALQNKDYKSTYKLCVILMKCGFPHSWEVCKKLATTAHFTDLEARLNLINFALCYCPLEEIQIVLRERKVIEAQYLCEECHRRVQLEGGAVRQLIERSSFTVQSLVSKGTGTMQQLMRQKNLESSRFSGKSHQEILKGCLSELIEIQNAKSKPMSSSLCVTLNYHPFYTHPTSTTGSISPAQSSTYFNWQEITGHLELFLPQAIYQVYSNLCGMDEGDNEGCGLVSSHKLLLQLARDQIDKDVHLFLGYLINLNKNTEEITTLQSQVVPSAFLYQLTMYYCCLELYVRNNEIMHSSPHPYTHNPIDIINHVMSYVTNLKQSDWPETCHPYLELLHTSKELLYDYMQAQKLLEFNSDIDISKFIYDSSYKKEAILSLARQGQAPVFQIALSLCHHHNIEDWNLYMSHLDWLLTESGFLADEVTRRVENGKVMKVLLQDPQKTADTLNEKTYPNIPATRYSLLYTYFIFLQQCVDEGATVTEKVSIDTHLRLLKKFKTTIREVNYRQLMSGEDPLSVLLPALGDHNIHVVAKLVKGIPLKDQGHVTSKMVYRAYAGKLFWQSDKQHSYTTSGWLNKFDSCRDCVQRLDAEQLQHLVVEIVFSDNSLNLMSIETRETLLANFVDICSERKITEGISSNILTFAGLLKELHCYQHHLKILKTSIMDTPSGIEQSIWRSVVKKYDLSMAIPDKIHQLTQDMCMLGLPLVCIDHIIIQASSVRSNKLTVRDIIMECLQTIVTNPSLEDIEGKIENILAAISDHEQKGGKLMQCSEVLTVLKPVYADQNQSLKLKYILIYYVNKYISLSQEDHQLLLLYQTQTTLSPHFKCKVTAGDLATPERQSHFYLSLLEQSSSLKQLETLARLLEEWPNSNGELFSECWLKVLVAIGKYPERNCGQKVVTIRAGLFDIDDKVDEELFKLLLKRDKRSALQLALLSTTNTTLLTTIIESIKQMTEKEVADLVTSTALELVLYNGRVPEILTTPIYPLFCSYLSNPPITHKADLESIYNVPLLVRLVGCNKDDLFEELGFNFMSKRVEKAAEQLQKANFHDEAGSLLESATQRSGRSSLLDVTSAFRSLKGFFS